MIPYRAIVRYHVGAVNQKSYRDQAVVGFDTETDGLHGPLTLASFASPEGKGTVTPGLVPGLLGDLTGRVVAGHNLGYDFKTLARGGWSPPVALYLDTQPAAHLLDETEPFPELGVLAERYLGRQLLSWEEVKDDLEALREYAIKDALASRDLARCLWVELAEQGLLNYWLKLECPQVPIIADMEWRGIKIDRAEVERRYKEGMAEVSALTHQLRNHVPDEYWRCPRERCVGGTFHPKRGDPRPDPQCDGTGLSSVWLNSGDIQGDILYQHFDLPIIERTKKAKKPSVDKYTLPRLRTIADENGKDAAVKYIDLMLRYRLVGKLMSTYYGPWLESGEDRIYPSFHQTGTVSGRWSSSGPSFQNLPEETRTCIIPDEGFAFLGVDYTQIELYLLGVQAGEERIVEGYAQGVDLHEITAQAIGVPRPQGKTMNFSIIYGVGLETAAKKLNSSVDEAKRLFDLVGQQFPNIDRYRTEVLDRARTNGYVSTLMGRRRRLSFEGNPWENGRAERQAFNHAMQGSVGDLIKSALIGTVLNVPTAQPVIQIHDEVIWQVPQDAVPQDEICECYRNSHKGLSPRVEANLFRERWGAK